ncbi:hypothetical protein COEREDRAFT_80051 [Coemansia reversa NRRL 1564]|uniref:DEK-C domain-containing protein n=1 Tax=Coemansia reversa (strain ATCC 12441 / NRRL 1564) TaxID=763665 RepID=A0A2G5BGG1_COERN|nr:hypothetical protein COEREDRAFT_80051 [Coemansia reversa NRRL 1564]|eukprot:PIA18118.1 hypothetical protein COEREDRAFT_80051 [Coemansia reversa NRRL 1564]
MPEIDVDALKKVCNRIVREGDLDSLTDRTVRRNAEKELGLTQKTLDEQPYKQLVKDTVSKVLESLTKVQQGSEDDGDVSDKDDTETSDNHVNNGGPAKSTEENSNSEIEDEYSDVMDEEPGPQSRSKKRDTSDSLPAPHKRAKTTVSSENGAAKGSASTIANLKSYINKCGLRKTWSKELGGMNGTQQVRHLKKMLLDLGMEGRPTLEKCKQIKAKRDLQAELDAMDQDNIIGDEDSVPQAELARSRRRAASKKVAYNVDHVSDSEEEGDDEKDDKAVNGSLEDGKDRNSDKNSNQDLDEEVQDESSEESDAYTENDSQSDTNGVASSEGEQDSEPGE